MNILCVGDIVGKPGREAFASLVKGLKEEFEIDLTVVNAENAAGGAGLTPKLADELLGAGADVLTLGDHVWDQKELGDYLEQSANVIRPANFPEGAPGKGACVVQTSGGVNAGVVNVLGRVFMRYHVDCPFRTLKKIVDEIRQETPIVLVDFHAETTSEKIAMGHFIDGQVSALWGTHTHVQTADEKVLPKKTAYVTDLGMTGPHDSVIGQGKEQVLRRFLTSMPFKFHVASGDILLNGAVVSVDEETGNARKIVRLTRPYNAKQ